MLKLLLLFWKEVSEIKENQRIHLFKVHCSKTFFKFLPIFIKFYIQTLSHTCWTIQYTTQDYLEVNQQREIISYVFQERREFNKSGNTKKPYLTLTLLNELFEWLLSTVLLNFYNLVSVLISFEYKMTKKKPKLQ